MAECPMCRATVSRPSLEELIAERSIRGHEAAILRTVWASAGRLVRADDFFDEMYEDDPDGGPSYALMYRDLYRAMERLETRIADSGVSVRRARRGWQLSLAGGQAA